MKSQRRTGATFIALGILATACGGSTAPGAASSKQHLGTEIIGPTNSPIVHVAHCKSADTMPHTTTTSTGPVQCMCRTVAKRTTWHDRGATGTSNIVTIDGNSPFNCIVHGVFINDRPDNDPWNLWHYRSGIKVAEPNTVVDQVHISNEGDGFKPLRAGQSFELSNSWLQHTHDDCVQNDEYLDGGVLFNNYFDGCYSGISARRSSGTTFDGAGKVMRLEHNLLSLESMIACYKPTKYRCPDHGGFFKWEDGDLSVALPVALVANTFMATSLPSHQTLGIPAPIYLNSAANCTGNTIDWLGPVGGFPTADRAEWRTKCPDTIINEGADARSDWNTKVAAWHAANPDVG